MRVSASPRHDVQPHARQREGDDEEHAMPSVRPARRREWWRASRLATVSMKAARGRENPVGMLEKVITGSNPVKPAISNSGRAKKSLRLATFGTIGSDGIRTRDLSLDRAAC